MARGRKTSLTIRLTPEEWKTLLAGAAGRGRCPPVVMCRERRILGGTIRGKITVHDPFGFSEPDSTDGAYER